MSLFKKPKKNIRRRVIGFSEDDGEDENNSHMEIEEEENVEAKENITKVKIKKHEQRKQTILSFEEDLNEADDGEVFQVKKSTQSKKLMKLLDRERKKRKEVKTDNGKAEGILENEIKPKENSPEIMVIEKNRKPPSYILNGREAEMAVRENESSDEEDTHHKFARPDDVRLVLQSGTIPDATIIHAARKKRQLARQMGGDFVSVETTRKNELSNSRLVREDDNDASDDEERITMDVNMALRERKRRHAVFMAAQDDGFGEESDKGEDDEWESQQIRKGVTGAQLIAAQQENFYQQYSAATEIAPAVLQTPVTSVLPEPVPEPTSNLMSSMGAPPPTLYAMADMQTAPPETLINKLRDRLTELKEVHGRHKLDQERVVNELLLTHEDFERLEKEGPTLAERFRFYQELRGYVTDLVECLDEKVPVIKALEERVLSLLKRLAEDLAERRRQDVRDQAEELAPISRTATTSASRRSREDEEARVRRAAEREGRRTRRRRARELRRVGKHMDGMSSDDEIMELDTNSFRNQKDVIETDARLVFDDVVDEFCSVRGVLRRFEDWRVTERDAYTEAYVSLCLPKVLGPIIRLKLITWFPLQDNSDLLRHKWYDSLLLYGLQESETEQSLKDDPDMKLVPLVMERIVVPKLNDLVEVQWDPLSTTQTTKLVNLLNVLLETYPTLIPSSKLLNKLFNTIISKMKASVENDVFIPIYPKQVLEAKGGGLGVFFQRQFGSAVKLLKNLLSLHGLVSDRVLREVAVDSLLNRYLLAALRTCEPVDGADKCAMIVATFPRSWFQPDLPMPQLSMFINQLKIITQCLDVSTPAGRDAMENITKILQSLLGGNSTA